VRDEQHRCTASQQFLDAPLGTILEMFVANRQNFIYHEHLSWAHVTIEKPSRAIIPDE